MFTKLVINKCSPFMGATIHSSCPLNHQNYFSFFFQWVVASKTTHSGVIWGGGF